MKIADLPVEAKPREKAFRYGVAQLTDQELLALLIGSGVQGHSAIEIAGSLIATYINLFYLSDASLNSLMKVKGLNRVGALKIAAAFELHRRLVLPLYSQNDALLEVSQIVHRFHYMEDLPYEVLILVMLNRKKQIIREMTKYRGTAQSLSFDFKEILSDLLESKCSSFILLHNHPDGSTKPSENDVISTFIIREKAEEFGIHLFDHVIIYKNGYYSFRENNHFE